MSSAAAGAASGPVFPGTNPFTASAPLGVRHAVSVGGTFQPLPMVCGTEQRVLWYAPGAAADSLWRHVDVTGGAAPTFSSEAVTVNGTYLARVGDFDADGCEDVLWASAGVGGDSIWYFHRDGSHAAVGVTVPTGADEAVVGEFSGDTADDVLWSGPGGFAERISTGSRVRGDLRTASAPQAAAAQSPVLVDDRSSVLWFGAGAVADVLWRGVRAGVSSPARVEALALSGSEEVHSFAGRALLYDAGSGRGRMVHGVLPAVALGLPSIPLTTDGLLGVNLRVSDGTARSRLGVLHAPGPSPDFLVDLDVAGRWSRVTPANDGTTPDLGRYAFGISEDGRYVVAGTGQSFDTMSVLDRTTGVRYLPPRAVGGGTPNGGLDLRPDLSVVVGRRAERIAFTSFASNLVPNDTNGRQDVFVWDRIAGTYAKAPDVGADRVPGVVGMSVDGGIVVIRSVDRANPNVNTGEILTWDLRTGVLAKAPGAASTSPVDSLARVAAVSANGRLLGFSARSAIAGVPGSGPGRAYLFDRTTGRFELQPAGVGGAAPNGRSVPVAFSADQSKVLLMTTATNLVAGASTGTRTAVIWDRSTGRYTAQPLGFDGRAPEGGHLGIYSSLPLAISADGSQVLLASASANLLPGAATASSGPARTVTTLYVWDVTTGRYLRQPRSASGAQVRSDLVALGPSAASADLGQVVVTTVGRDLAPGDTDGTSDGYLWDRS